MKPQHTGSQFCLLANAELSFRIEVILGPQSSELDWRSN